MHGRHPAVLKLPVHLEKQQYVQYADDDPLQEIMEKYERTLLMAWFLANQANLPVGGADAKSDKTARDYMYIQFPEFYIYNYNAKAWQARKANFQIGRLSMTNPG